MRWLGPGSFWVMRAAIVKDFGPILVHTVGDLPEPIPNAGEVLVTVKATAVNFVDSLVMTGKYQFLPQRPFVPGKLPVGVVSSLGQGVCELQVGDRVLTLAEQGGYAQKIAVDAKTVDAGYRHRHLGNSTSPRIDLINTSRTCSHFRSCPPSRLPWPPFVTSSSPGPKGRCVAGRSQLLS